MRVDSALWRALLHLLGRPELLRAGHH